MSVLVWGRLLCFRPLVCALVSSESCVLPQSLLLSICGFTVSSSSERSSWEHRARKPPPGSRRCAKKVGSLILGELLGPWAMVGGSEAEGKAEAQRKLGNGRKEKS